MNLMALILGKLQKYQRRVMLTLFYFCKVYNLADFLDPNRQFKLTSIYTVDIW